MSPTKAAHRRAEALRSKKSDSTRKPSANSPPPAYQRRGELRGSDDQYLAARSTAASDGNGDSFGEFSHNAAELQAQSTQPLSDINSIAAVYGALDAEQIAFLRERPELLPVLLQAKELIYKFFKTKPKLSLALSDADSAYPDLFIEVQTSLPASEAATLIEKFADAWHAEPYSTSPVDIIATLVFI